MIVLPGNPDVSQGRTPDGAVTTTYLALPTPGFSNGSDLTADTAVMNGLRITEIMFDPAAGPEYLEFKNISGTPLTITGVNFGSGLTFTFPATTITAGGYAVITQNLASFNSQYPGVTAVQWSAGRLDNNGESLRITTSTYGLGILDFRYEGNWYPETRSGASLEIVDPTADRTSWSDQASWQPSAPSPGGPSPFGVLAPADVTVLAGFTGLFVLSAAAAILGAWVSPGTHAAGDIGLAWQKVSGPGSVTFTAPANKVTDAVFSLPGIYELSITATPPGGGPEAIDTVIVTAAEDYGSWATRRLSSASTANQLPEADADGDGQVNLIEYAMGTNPAAWSAGPELIISGGHLALRYPVSRLIDPAVQIIPQLSPGLTTWFEGAAFLVDTITQQTDSIEIHVVQDVNSLGMEGRSYLRLKVVAP